MGYSEVPRIELNQDGTVTIFVNVAGFQADTPVEISGYAVQTNGAMATFRDIQPMPAGAPSKGAIFTVTSVPVIGSTFTESDPIMAVAQAADIWITKLDQDMQDKDLDPDIVAAKALVAQNNTKAAWNSDGTTYHSVFAPRSAYSGQPSMSGQWSAPTPTSPPPQVSPPGQTSVPAQDSPPA